jgi:membrane protease YdiL (CAAX protease family)
VDRFPWTILFIGGGLGPCLAAIISVVPSVGTAVGRDYLTRLVDWKRIPPGWQAVVWLFWPALVLFSIGAAGWISAETANWTVLRGYLVFPLSLVPFVLQTFIFGPLPEEMGWRGWALDLLLKRQNPLTASLILGTIWALWHFPLFLLDGTYQNQIGFGSAEFWWFNLNLLTGSVLYTWIYCHTERSTLAAGLFHFMTNLSGELLTPGPAARTICGVLLTVIAIGVGGLMVRPRGGAARRI